VFFFLCFRNFANAPEPLARSVQSRNQNKPQRNNHSADKPGGDGLFGSCGNK
jgi:hypothetical protein